MELDAIKNQKQLKPRSTKCELQLNVNEFGEDGEPTEECLLLLLAVARIEMLKFNRESFEYFTLHSISKVEWVAGCLPIIRFTYYATSEEIVDEE